MKSQKELQMIFLSRYLTHLKEQMKFAMEDMSSANDWLSKGIQDERTADTLSEIEDLSARIEKLETLIDTLEKINDDYALDILEEMEFYKAPLDERDKILEKYKKLRE